MIRLNDLIAYLEKDRAPGQPNRADLTVITCNRLKFARLLKRLGCSLQDSDEDILAAIRREGLGDYAAECGGQLLHLDQAALAYKDKKGRALFRKPATSSNPQHRKHDTRNLSLPSGQVRSVHALLIVKFNSQTVTL